MTARRTLPPRYPPTSAWPGQLRADMVAAFLDYPDTKALAAAIARGEAPSPSALRGQGRAREPVWNLEDLERFVAPRLASRQDESYRKDLAALVPTS
jgi:hypothetical protein